jgi:hypothetical protein
MWRRRSLEECLKDLGTHLLDTEGLKAVMMSKNDDGDVFITLVEGTEESHKVKFGRVDRHSRTLERFRPEQDTRLTVVH